MKVIAKPGIKCPKEGKPREYITDDTPVDVPDDSSYYRRLIKDGSLLPFNATVGAGLKPAQKKDKGGKE